jgi:hypothetical protein
MLATSAPQRPEGGQWSYEVKWDGYRTLAVKDGARVTLLSRNLNVARVCGAIRDNAALLDGEIVAIVEQRSSSERLQHHTVHTIRSTNRTLTSGRHILNSAARGDDRASPGDKGRHGDPDEVLGWSLLHSPRSEMTEPERAWNHNRSTSRLQT